MGSKPIIQLELKGKDENRIIRMPWSGYAGSVPSRIMVLGKYWHGLYYETSNNDPSKKWTTKLVMHEGPQEEVSFYYDLGDIFQCECGAKALNHPGHSTWCKAGASELELDYGLF